MFKNCCCKKGHRVSSQFYKIPEKEVVALARKHMLVSWNRWHSDIFTTNAVCLDYKAAVPHTHQISDGLRDDVVHLAQSLLHEINELEGEKERLLSEIAELKKKRK